MPQVLEPRIGTLSPDLVSVVATSSDTQSPSHQLRFDERWRPILDALEAWRQDPEQLADDGLEPPSPSMIRQALDEAESMRDRGYVAPDQVIPDPNGGIIFQMEEGRRLRAIHIWEDGSVEYLQFDGARLVERQPWNCG